MCRREVERRQRLRKYRRVTKGYTPVLEVRRCYRRGISFLGKFGCSVYEIVLVRTTDKFSHVERCE